MQVYFNISTDKATAHTCNATNNYYIAPQSLLFIFNLKLESILFTPYNGLKDKAFMIYLNC